MKRLISLLLLTVLNSLSFANDNNYILLNETSYKIKDNRKIYLINEIKYIQSGRIVTEYRLENEVPVLCVNTRQLKEKTSKLMCDTDADGEFDETVELQHTKEVAWIKNNFGKFTKWFIK